MGYCPAFSIMNYFQFEVYKYIFWIMVVRVLMELLLTYILHGAESFLRS
jgi:hypothetical protein